MATQNRNRESVLKFLALITVLAVATKATADQEALPPSAAAIPHPKNEAARQSKENHNVIIFGTAFFYNDTGDMFTNRHVVGNCDPKTYEFESIAGNCFQRTLLQKVIAMTWRRCPRNIIRTSSARLESLRTDIP